MARHSQRGWRIDKPRKEINIDAMIALAMVVDRAEHQPAPSSSSDGSRRPSRDDAYGKRRFPGSTGLPSEETP